jgi:NCAIR mutase (PurE)-related protein
MNVQALRELLDQVSQGKVAPEAALERLRRLPFQDLGFANVDTHRALRCGVPEVIFCPGKTPAQVAGIAQRLLAEGSAVMATRADAAAFEAVRAVCPAALFHEAARIIVCHCEPKEPPPGKVLIVSAGTSDIPVAEEARVTAEVLGNRVEKLYDVGVAGIHRLLQRADHVFEANVLIVVAGMEGALASVVGGLTSRPVIAVPTSIGYGASFGGLAALLAMLNSCASSVCVVNIDNGFGAGYIASLINHTNLVAQPPSAVRTGGGACATRAPKGRRRPCRTARK